MKLPKKLNLFGIEYTILYFNDEKKVNTEGDELLWGMMNPGNNTIRLFKGNREPQAIWRDLWHEILHNVIDNAHIKIPGKFEEEIIDTLSLHVNDILFRNKLYKEG